MEKIKVAQFKVEVHHSWLDIGFAFFFGQKVLD